MDAREALAGLRAARPLESARLRRTRPHRPRLLVRVALHQEDELISYPDLVRERYHAWLLQQENAGRVFSIEQLAWLERIRDHVAAALAITTDDFGYTPFVEAGGLGKAAQVFGDGLGPLLDVINEALAA